MHVTKHIHGWRNMDRDAVRAVLPSKPSITDLATLAKLTVSDMFAVYETVMGDLINNLVPFHPARVRHCPVSPWFNAEYRSLHFRLAVLKDSMMHKVTCGSNQLSAIGSVDACVALREGTGILRCLDHLSCQRP